MDAMNGQLMLVDLHSEAGTQLPVSPVHPFVKVSKKAEHPIVCVITMWLVVFV